MRQNTVAQSVATRYILDLCEGTDITTRVHVGMKWWYKSEIKMKGSRERAAVGGDADEDGGEQ